MLTKIIIDAAYVGFEGLLLLLSSPVLSKHPVFGRVKYPRRLGGLTLRPSAVLCGLRCYAVF